MVNKEENRERSKQGGPSKEKAREELLSYVSKGGCQSRAHLKKAWDTGTYPLSEPTWVIEQAFGSWSAFLSFCGLAILYDASPAEEQLTLYLKDCSDHGAYLTHYAYNRMRFDSASPHKYSSRVKRFREKIPDLRARVEAMIAGEASFQDCLAGLLRSYSSEGTTAAG